MIETFRPRCMLASILDLRGWGIFNALCSFMCEVYVNILHIYIKTLPFKTSSNRQQSQYCMLRESIWNTWNRKDEFFLLDSLSASVTISLALNQIKEKFLAPLISDIAKGLLQTPWTSLQLLLHVFHDLSTWSCRDCCTINQMNEGENDFMISAFLEMNYVSQKS